MPFLYLSSLGLKKLAVWSELIRRCSISFYGSVSLFVSAWASVSLLVLLHRAVSPLLLLLSCESPTLSLATFVCECVRVCVCVCVFILFHRKDFFRLQLCLGHT